MHGDSPSAGDVRDAGSVPGSGRSLGKGSGNSLQYSCLENPTDRGAWPVTVYEVAESDKTEHYHKFRPQSSLMQKHFLDETLNDGLFMNMFAI